ncbi:hypothetical protein SBOR_6533 [Sclerotinia borealis F-4128]|uniref:Apple domain-containing protein n=1 Tax=Sclerotinia borealis (strain F-4128) TaxID=1432307 RepID=W9CB98_SCLBF|nr:hypothetical protein SBOR_6533 [Sclerotinia borealis F-4128]
MGLTRSTLAVFLSLLLVLQPLANAQDQAQGRPGASAPASAPAPAAGRPGAPPPDQVPVQPSASVPAPAAGRPGAQVPVTPSTPPAVDPAQPRPKVYSCPADNGARYTTANGVTFELKCDHGTIAKPLDATTTNSQRECADYCSTLPNCQSADWNDRSKMCATKQEVCFHLYFACQLDPLTSAVHTRTHTWFPLEERMQRPDVEPRTPPECPAPKIALAESVTASASFTADGQCPTNDGKIFLTPQGTYFQVKCASENTAAVGIPGSRPLHDFAECMTACADIPECKSITFAGGKPNWECKMFDTGVESLVADATSQNKASAILIDPPTSNKVDDLTMLCSTECPNADGQTWVSDTGEQFRMDCCKRHGTITIGQTQTASLEECMKLCALALPCQSVDWQRDSGNCYFGKHSGAPTIAASGWASAHSMGCAGACKKSTGGCCGGQ